MLKNMPLLSLDCVDQLGKLCVYRRWMCDRHLIFPLVDDSVKDCPFLSAGIKRSPSPVTSKMVRDSELKSPVFTVGDIKLDFVSPATGPHVQPEARLQVNRPVYDQPRYEYYLFHE